MKIFHKYSIFIKYKLQGILRISNESENGMG